jgi:hypothetical protein
MAWTKDSKGVWQVDHGQEGYVYVEPGTAIMVKVAQGTDPVEMTADEARELAALLNELADELDATNGQEQLPIQRLSGCPGGTALLNGRSGSRD